MIGQIPWIGRPLGFFPFFYNRMYKLGIFGAKVATARVESGSKEKDLWYHLVSAPLRHGSRLATN